MKQHLGVKSQFINSSIFETPEECKNNPFIFEKYELKTQAPTEYENIKRAGKLLRMVNKNKKEVSKIHKLMRLKVEHGNNMIGTPISGPQNELKENFYVYTGHKLIKFNVSIK